MTNLVVIVGAPRSGTNMLRDVLTSLPGFVTWECDEINPLWKHGNLDIPHDELARAHARPEVRRYLRRAFDAALRRRHGEVLVEKTCATSLRVGFVDEVFPQARFVVIRRDGIDATASAMKRWHAPFDLAYTARKVRFVPPVDLPRIAWSAVAARVRGRRKGTDRLDGADPSAAAVQSWWGPRPHDVAELRARHPLPEAAFLQWQRCVEATFRDLAEIDRSRWQEVIYEDFVADPAAGLTSILGFLGRPEVFDPAATAAVRDTSVGKGRSALGPAVVVRLEELGGETLRDLGYA